MNEIFSSLERVFHEPSRFAIASALLEQNDGLTFSQLKVMCGLTDGNLSGHLQALERSGAIQIAKSFADRKPKTTVHYTSDGRDQFLHYLSSLETAVKHAKRSAAK